MQNWRAKLKDAALVFWLLAAIMGFASVTTWLATYEAPPQSEEETHIEAVAEMHASMHKGRLPHPWFHPDPVTVHINPKGGRL